MGRPDRCPACGLARPRGSATCPSCGEADGLVLESAAVERDGAPGTDVDFGGRSSRRWPKPVLIAAVVVAIGAGAVMTGRDSGPTGADPVPTTVPSTVPTSGPDGPTTPTTLPVGAVEEPPAYSLDRAFAAFLPTRSGAVLYGLSDEGEVVRIDVDRGEIARRRLRGPNGERPDGFAVLGRQGGAVLASPGGFRNGGSLAVDDGPAGRTRWFSGRGARVLPAAAPAEIWRVTSRADDGPSAAQRITFDGISVGPIIDVPASATVLGDDGTGRLLLSGPGGAYVVGADATPERVAEGEVVAWTATTLVTAVCDPTLRCTLRVLDRASGLTRELAVSGDVRPGVAAALSGDGRWLAAVRNGADAGLEVVDLVSGERRRLDDPVLDAWAFGYAAAGVWWSPTGSHLFWLDGDGRVKAWAPGGEPVVLDGLGRLPALRSLSVAPLAERAEVTGDDEA